MIRRDWVFYASAVRSFRSITNERGAAAGTCGRSVMGVYISSSKSYISTEKMPNVSLSAVNDSASFLRLEVFSVLPG